MTLMISLRASLLGLLLLFVTGCCSVDPNVDLTAFPPSPTWKVYTNKPVVSYDKETQTYVITKDYMKNSLWMKMYIDGIISWKEYNKID